MDLKFEMILQELSWQFEKSSGPGGQHVNTTDSKAKASWMINTSKALSPEQLTLLKKNLKSYLNKSQDQLQISSDLYRSRERNKQDCIKKLKKLLVDRAFFKPKKRISTKPTKSSIKKRLDSKTKHSTLKQSRKKVEP